MKETKEEMNEERNDKRKILLSINGKINEIIREGRGHERKNETSEMRM
jgi:hypothetical protein